MYLLSCSMRSAVSGTGGISVVYVLNALVAIGASTMVAVGTISLAFPVLFIDVYLMAWWLYPRHMSLWARDLSLDSQLPVLQGQL